jgi:hypothetical protein
MKKFSILKSSPSPKTYCKVVLNDEFNKDAEIVTVHGGVIRTDKYKSKYTSAENVARDIANALNLRDELSSINSKTTKLDIIKIINKFKH